MNLKHEKAGDELRRIVTFFRHGVISVAELTGSPYENIVEDHSVILMKDIERVAQTHGLPVSTLIGMTLLDRHIAIAGARA